MFSTSSITLSLDHANQNLVFNRDHKRRLSLVAHQLSELDQAYTDIDEYALEQHMAERILWDPGAWHHPDAVWRDDDFIDPPHTALELIKRRPIEPAINRTVSELASGTALTRRSLFRLHGGIFAKNASKARRGSVRTTPNRHGCRINYPPAKDLPAGIQHLLCYARGDTGCAIEKALNLMVKALILHPFDDGNGRFARALFQTSLIKSQLMRRPILPLGPLIFHWRPRHARTLLLYEIGDATEPLAATLVEMVLKSIDLARQAFNRAQVEEASIPTVHTIEAPRNAIRHIADASGNNRLGPMIVPPQKSQPRLLLNS